MTKRHILFGVPLYHGTARDFDSFSMAHVGSENPSDWGKGIYFTRKKFEADRYRRDAVKNADPEYNRLADEFQEHEKKNWKGHTLDPAAQDESYRLLKKFQDRCKELDKSSKGRIITMYLAPDAKIWQHRHHPGCIIDQALAQTAADRGYDALLIDKGYWTEEIVVMNLNKLLPHPPIPRRHSLRRIPIRRKDGAVQHYHVKRLTA